MVSRRKRTEREDRTGRLRIGDTWNAITIIAMSQTNPLKAIAEFVENSIDARAKNITIVRGRKDGGAFLRITDDGEGIPRNQSGLPDFKYVATHICDSIKRQLKGKGATGIQGEYGIGLLSFWTVGDQLTITSAGSNGQTYQMLMVKGDPGYRVQKRRFLFPPEGTEILISPILSGIRQLSGEKIQWYLSSELRDRIRTSEVKIKVVDRSARKEFKVEPRQFSGRLLHQLPSTTSPFGDVYIELYMAQSDPENRPGLYRSGTRVLPSITSLDRFNREPWISGYINGIVDAPFLRLTPGTRSGIILDDAYAAFSRAMETVETTLAKLVAEQREAEEQKASRHTLKSVQKALREALLSLPSEEYDWFDVRMGGWADRKAAQAIDDGRLSAEKESEGRDDAATGAPAQKQFFEYEGPLYSVRIAPSSALVQVRAEKDLRAVPRDKKRQVVERDLNFRWGIVEGEGRLSSADGECVTFTASREPCLTRIQVKVVQSDIECEAEALITVTDSLVEAGETGPKVHKGLPGYTFHKAPGELWRSKYDNDRNLIVINNGHRDFVYASRNKTLRLRYISRLFAKELVLRNFPGIPPDQLIERMIELSLYTEEHLR